MLKITVHETPGSISLELAGSVKDVWVLELDKIWSSVLASPERKTVRVDLGSVNFVDSAGKQLLLQMRDQGASLVGCSSFLRELLELEIMKSQVRAKDSREA